MAYELAKDIGSFDSWTDVMHQIIELAREADEKCTFTELEARRAYVYGALCALRSAYGWDQTRQRDQIEESILWMFTQIYIR